MEIIKTESLSKFYGVTPASDNISIHVNEGEIYGFIGLNGAGKTTLIRMLLGMIKPDEGELSLFGKKMNPRFNLWNNVGYLVETPNSYPNLSVVENLKVYYHLRQLNDLSLLESIIQDLKLVKYKNVKAKHLSLGNKQRLGLAKALMHRPQLLILDEPINGLDPEGIVEVRELLKKLARNGSTIFLSSHILGEVSKIANRIGIIRNGKLIKELTNQELSEQLIKKVVVQTTDNTAAIKYLSSNNYAAVINDENEIELNEKKAILQPENLSRILTEAGFPPKQLYLFTEDLEMYFLRNIR
ncbi:ATP-binding cassette domain-containing protein [Marivirga sp. S37H4]|uniref:ATP-binding cassette domain-containing protein n=1 Tax=Marivirga aurantiaca TaxID=2802615 RepID=A0A934X1B9_9BACT|nr:ATP-binding cassette domain-containing protein [Marivirga aurantiaca]MBK6267158.1 ATP-binding cassette domain-containing protein [Marivirga aurantiaca]